MKMDPGSPSETSVAAHKIARSQPRTSQSEESDIYNIYMIFAALHKKMDKFNFVAFEILTACLPPPVILVIFCSYSQLIPPVTFDKRNKHVVKDQQALAFVCV